MFGVWCSYLISVCSYCYFEKVSLVFGVWCLVFEAVQLSPLISDQSLTSLVSDSFQTIGHFDFRLVSESHTQLVFSKDVTFKVCLSKVVRSSRSFVGHHLVLLGLHRCLGSHLYQWVVFKSDSNQFYIFNHLYLLIIFISLKDIVVLVNISNQIPTNCIF